ncbi:MAG: nucleoside deaminase [Micavibrio sp.]
MSLSDKDYMALALKEAQDAAARDEVPIGAILVHKATGTIYKGGNQTIADKDPTAHAEIVAIRQACAAAGAQRIPDYDLYVTLEPCAMCAAAISFARIDRVIFGASDPKGGGILHGGRFYEQPTCHHKPVISSGLMADDCGKILKDFFAGKRG